MRAVCTEHPLKASATDLQESRKSSRAHQAQERHTQALVAIVKEALVQQRQQSIQDGRVGLEDLVDERHLGCGQIPVCLPDVLIILQT